MRLSKLLQLSIHVQLLASVLHGSQTESALINDIMADYNRLARPSVRLDDPVKVRMRIDLLALEPDLLNHRLNLLAIHTLNWKDPNLKWTRIRYKGQGSVVLPIDEIWIPDIAILNTYFGQVELRDLGRGKSAVVQSDGHVRWSTSVRTEIMCTFTAERRNGTQSQYSCIIHYGSLYRPDHELQMTISDIDHRSLYTKPCWSFLASQIWSKMAFTGVGAQKLSDVCLTMTQQITTNQTCSTPINSSPGNKTGRRKSNQSKNPQKFGANSPPMVEFVDDENAKKSTVGCDRTRAEIEADSAATTQASVELSNALASPTMQNSNHHEKLTGEPRKNDNKTLANSQQQSSMILLSPILPVFMLTIVAVPLQNF